MRLPVFLLCATAVLLGGSARAQSPGVVVLSPKAGLDMGQQIASCVAQLTQPTPPATPLEAQGGVCDARAFSGVQYNLAGGVLNIGVPEQPVELLLGRVTLYTNQTIKVQEGSSIIGMPGAVASVPRPGPIGVPGAPGEVGFAASVIKQYPGANLDAVVELDGGFNVLQDLVVDGGKDKNTSGDAILVNRASRTQMIRVVAQFAPFYGISILSGPPGVNPSGYRLGNDSCCGKLQNILSMGNAKGGLYSVDTADIFISLSEFENNGGSGIELCDSPSFRIEHSDIGGNAEDGLRIYGDGNGYSSDREIIIGDQFGNNQQDDVHIYGASSGNLLSSNQFIGASAPYYRKSGSDGIRLVSGSNNVILGNMFFKSEQPLHACIETPGGLSVNQLSANLCPISTAVPSSPIFPIPPRSGGRPVIPPGGNNPSGFPRQVR